MLCVFLSQRKEKFKLKLIRKNKGKQLNRSYFSINNFSCRSLAESSYINFLYKCRDIAIRIRKFTESIERILPKEISEEVNGNKTVTARINLFIGVRHFVMGIKQIANTLENILSGGDSGESKQL